MIKMEQILQAVLTTLKTVSGVNANNVVRSRVDPFLSKNLPSISLEPVSDIPDASHLGFVDWTLTIKINLFVRGDVPDATAAPILESIHTKMMADQTFGGLVFYTAPQAINFDFDDGDKPLLSASYDFELKYRTNN